MNKLSPSILAADFSVLGEQIKRADEAGSDYIHVDVLDGEFVPSISLGMPVISSIRKVTDKVFDVHLMVHEPIRYIEDFVAAGADMIVVHFEACENLDATLDKIRSHNKKCGIAINPLTPIEVVEPYLNEVDMILIMTVNPGFGGQKYIEFCTEKIVRLKNILDEKELDVDIEVDGGIKKENLSLVLEAGANVIVAGSAIFNGSIEENVYDFLKVMKEYE